jgi:hypothetical protein
MPIHLESLDVSSELENFKSVLSPICPPMSLAMQTSSPFIEFFKRGLRMEAFEDYIKVIREPLEQRGVRIGVCSSYLPCRTMCPWTKGQRRRSLERANDYDAVVVLGCDSATQTAREPLEGSNCKVVQAMRSIGVANATVRFRFPMTVDLRDTSYVGAGKDTKKAGA